MNKNYNIEELKYLVADHLSGQISAGDKEALEKALGESAELRGFYEETKKTLEFVRDVKFEEPAPQYWNSLLPRIHEKIDKRQSEAFSWGKISSVWKILVPMAAILLIAIIYYIAKPKDPGITKDVPKQNIEEIKKDPSREQIEKKDENVKPEIDNTAKEERRIPESIPKKRKLILLEENSIVKGEHLPQDRERPDEEPSNGSLTATEIEETSIFGGGEAAGLDEETENELKKLNDSEKRTLLQELEDINL
jgi:hypothetical protein